MTDNHKPTEHSAADDQAVEPDDMPAMLIAKQLILVGIGVVIIGLGLWRLLVYQANQQQRQHQAAESSPEVLLLRSENEGKLRRPASRDLKTKRARVPIADAIRRVSRSPRLLAPLAPPPKPMVPPAKPEAPAPMPPPMSDPSSGGTP